MSRPRATRVYWAHQLHATLLNSIGAAILQSQVCEQAVRSALPTSAEELATLRRMLVTLESETRALAASATRPRGDNLHVEVSNAVRAARRRGVPVSVRLLGPSGAVPRRIVRGVAVVLTEALANAARHAHPASIEVEVTVQEHALLMRVRDDGAGCDIVRLEDALNGAHRCGIAIMRAQAATLDGRLEISSAPGRGTQVSLFIPLAGPRRSSGEASADRDRTP
jgi:signal transduction histidine kinase